MNTFLPHFLSKLSVASACIVWLLALPASAQTWENQKRWVVYDNTPPVTQTVSADQKWRMRLWCGRTGLVFRVDDVSGNGGFIPRNGDFVLTLAVDGRPVPIEAKSVLRATYEVRPEMSVLEALASGTQAVFSVNGLNMEFTLTNARAAIGEVVCPNHPLASGLTAETAANRARKAVLLEGMPPNVIHELELLAQGIISVNNLTFVVTLTNELINKCGLQGDQRTQDVVIAFNLRHYVTSTSNPNPRNPDPLLRALSLAQIIDCDSPFVDEFFRAVTDATETNLAPTRFTTECRARESRARCSCFLAAMEAVDPRVRSKGFSNEVLGLVQRQDPSVTARYFSCELS